MAKIRKKTSKPTKVKKVKISQRKPVEDKIAQYRHDYTKRPYNPPVGLVTPETDIDMPTQKYSYDPHLDPQLFWSGKTENTSFEIDTVSLHVHERIDPLTIINKVLKNTKDQNQKTMFEFFGSPENNPPLREAIEFYKHDQSWSNRLIAGDSLLVMNSLLQKEGMGDKVQMVYMDPPYGINYGSNFQPFINKRNVKEGNDEDLTQEPEMIKAFRDTWELGIHSYLTQLRDRLLLVKELLADSGSCFIQISDENVHLVRIIMDEIFGRQNFMSIISFRTKIPLRTTYLAGIADYIIWYAKDSNKVKFRKLFATRSFGGETQFTWIQLLDGTRRKMTMEEKNDPSLLPKGAQPFRLTDLVSAGRTESCVFEIEIDGQKFNPSGGKSWKTNRQGMEELIKKQRVMVTGNSPSYVFFLDDYPVQEMTNLWIDTQGASDKKYVVQTAEKVIQRCMLMTTDPGDLVFDPTCGAGTTAYVAEEWGRRWITCDTSRVSLAIAKQRLMTAIFDYYELSHSNEGIKSGFKYKSVPHITLGAIAQNQPTETEILYNQPIVDKTKVRILGPFTVEAVPSPVVKSLDSDSEFSNIDASITRTGETSRQEQWRDEILKTGVRGKGGQILEFSRVEPLGGTQWLHADGETKEKDPKRVVISFGPVYSPLEQRQVARAIEEAEKLVPKPKIIIFAAFQFDPEAAKDIDELKWPGVTILKAQMNADLLTEDLKKQRTSNESFWLMGQPDVGLKKMKDGRYVVEVNGFDYYNTKTGEIESGDSSKIAMWMLDTDYDGRSLYPQQVFFPLSGSSDGWSKLARNLKAEIDEELLEQYAGTVSLPFLPGDNKQIAVIIIDDRGIESLRILRVD